MKSELIDLTGKKFGLLEVVRQLPTRITPNKTKQTMWECRCDCGEVVSVRAGDLRRRDGKAIRACHSCANTVHGHTAPGWQSITYQAWRSMIGRCARCIDYLEKGITVCDRWRTSFAHFLSDLGERPGREYTLDRMNNDGHYEPGNCRWATKTEQARNTKANVWIEIGERRMLLTDWLTEVGMTSGTYYHRISRGLSPAEVIQGKKPPPYQKTEEHKRNLAKAARRALTEEMKEQIRRRHEGGESVAAIARSLGVGHSTVARACGATY